MERTVTIEERIKRHSMIDLDTGCILWTAVCNERGYGKVRYNRKTVRVHRLVWELKYGTIPDGLELDHLCKVRNCLNVDHLEAVTHAENIRRGDHSNKGGKHNKVKTHCKHGHPFDNENTLIDMRGYRRCKACIRNWRVKRQIQRN